MQLDASIAAVITGGASGLGAATARRLRGHGVRVALFDLNAELGERVAGEIGGVFCRVDVTSDAEVDAGFAQARGRIGQERILVNCAGIGGAFKTAGRDKETSEIRHFPLDVFARIIDINLIGTFRCIARAAAGMLKRDHKGSHRPRSVTLERGPSAHGPFRRATASSRLAPLAARCSGRVSAPLHVRRGRDGSGRWRRPEPARG